nr:HAD family hydrolase [Microvirga roseola]
MKPELLFFDVGGTLVDEERYLAAWAEWLGVPPGTFFAVLGTVIEGRRDYQGAFRYFRPGFDMARERQARTEAGLPNGFLPSDLYPDTVPTLRWAREQGYRLGFAGNHSAQTESFLQELGVEAEFIGSSESWGVAKPDPRSSKPSRGAPACRPARSPISATASTTTSSRRGLRACRPSSSSGGPGEPFRPVGRKPQTSGSGSERSGNRRTCWRE